ncbi:hypothetical protein JCM1840_007132 [Sporobolomyces johnsonii]
MPKSRSTRARTSTAAPYNGSSPQSSPTCASTSATLAADLAQEFKAWSDSRGFSDGHAVRGDKLAVFLHDEVVYRAPCKRGRKADPNSVRSRAKAKKAALPPSIPRSQTARMGREMEGALQEVQEVLTLTKELLYKAAIIDLYQQQVSLRINSHPHPDSFPELGKLIKQVKSETHKIKCSKYVKIKGVKKEGKNVKNPLIVSGLSQATLHKAMVKNMDISAPFVKGNGDANSAWLSGEEDAFIGSDSSATVTKLYPLSFPLPFA